MSPGEAPEPELPEEGDPDTAALGSRRRQVPGSNAFVPSAAGLIIASEVVRELSGWRPAP